MSQELSPTARGIPSAQGVVERPMAVRAIGSLRATISAREQAVLVRVGARGERLRHLRRARQHVLLRADERGEVRVQVVCETTSQYPGIMTRSPWMPVLIDERI